MWQTCDTYRNNWSQTCVLSSCISIFAKDAHYATEWAWQRRVTGVKILVSSRTLFCVKWSGKKMLCTHTNLYFWENYFFVSIMSLKLYRFFRKTCIVCHRVDVENFYEFLPFQFWENQFFVSKMWLISYFAHTMIFIF